MIGSNRFCHFGGWSDPGAPRGGSGRATGSSGEEGASRAAASGDEGRCWAARPAQAEDFDAWEELFAGYCDFYRRPSTPEHRRQVWSWIEAGKIHCLLAVAAEDAVGRDAAEASVPESGAAESEPTPATGNSAAMGQAIGLAHVRPAFSPLRGATVGFLDDLFIAPPARGSGAFECLIVAIRDLAADQGWPQVRWITAADNARARAAYDRVATQTDWVTYQLDI